MDTDTVIKIGAAYAALQGVANAMMIVMGENRKNTVLFKICKLIVAGPARAPVA